MNTGAKIGATAAVIGGILLVAVSVPAGWAIRYYTAPIEGKVQVQEQTHTSSFMMAAYNYFFAANEQIKAYDVMISSQESLLASCSEEIHDTILLNIAGIKGQKAQSIAEYNAKAQAEWTTGQFRDWQLPYHIDQ